MDLPGDEELWVHVDILASTSAMKKWTCKHCKEEFAGEAPSIRNHLYHQGNNILHCSQLQLTRLAQDNNIFAIEKSVWKWEYEVNTYMLSVKKSWTKTSSSFICYNFNLHKHTLIYGFYSPKGFIFVQGPQSDGLKNNTLNLSFDDTRGIDHDEYHACELICTPDLVPGPFGRARCIPSVIQTIWDEICEKLEWVKKVIQTSERVYSLLLSHPDASQMVQEVFKKYGDGIHMSSFARLKSIVQLKHRKTLVAKEIWFVDDERFWYYAKKLIRALNPLLDLVRLMDTLCPVAAYTYLGIERANERLRGSSYYHPRKFQPIWDCFTYYFPGPESLYTCINPIHHDLALGYIYGMMMEMSTSMPELVEELDRFKDDNPFAKLSYDLLQDHPVKLWEKYGGDEFPGLKARVIKELSRAGSCMCNQIKKRLEQIQDCDDVVMRLNYMMMEKFVQLEDSIYTPRPEWVYDESDIESGEEADNQSESDEENDIQSGEEH